MGTKCLTFLLVLVAISVFADDIVTTDGKVFKDVKVLKEGTDGRGIAIQHSNGAAKVPFSKMSEADKVKYGYDASKEKVAIDELARQVKVNGEKRKADEQKEAQEEARRRVWAEYENTPEFDSANLKVGALGKGNTFRVSQVIDERNMLVVMEMNVDWEHETVWIQGINTNGVVDGGRFELDKVCKVTGTKKYTTVMGGSRTVYVIEPVPMPFSGPAPAPNPNLSPVGTWETKPDGQTVSFAADGTLTGTWAHGRWKCQAGQFEFALDNGGWTVKTMLIDKDTFYDNYRRLFKRIK